MSATPIADMVDAMIERGAAVEVIAVAVRTVESSRDASRDASRDDTLSSRSLSAIRSARYREKLKHNKALAKANDVANTSEQGVTPKRDETRDGVTERSNLSFFSEEERGLQEGKNTASVVEGQTKKVSRGTRLPADWQPDAELRKFAQNLGVNPDAARAEFVDYWTGIPGSRGLKVNWPGTFRNRVREIAKRRPASNAHNSPFNIPGVL